MSCPFSTAGLRTLRVPTVPATVSTDVPLAPSASGDLTLASPLLMGGTTPPFESSVRTVNQTYQTKPPRMQNTLEPCSVSGPAPLFGKHPTLTDPNSRRHACVVVKDENQGVQGALCNNANDDGSLYTDPANPNGNADWVRGNRFAAPFNGRMIDDRIRYETRVPAMTRGNRQYVLYDPFYPKPDRCWEQSEWAGEYPQANAGYTKTGFPTWTSSDVVAGDVRLIEGFGEPGSGRTWFWLGATAIMVSLVLTTPLHKK